MCVSEGSTVCVCQRVPLCVSEGSTVYVSEGSTVCVSEGSTVCVSEGSTVCVRGFHCVCVRGLHCVCGSYQQSNNKLIGLLKLHVIFTSSLAPFLCPPSPPQVDPPVDPWLLPHSCGEICDKPLQPECGHRCVTLCHPGEPAATPPSVRLCYL